MPPRQKIPFSRFAIVPFIVFAVLASTSCQTGAPAAAKLNVGMTSYLSFAPLFIAQEEGYFAAQNLDVTFQTFDNATQITPALEAGQLDAAGDSPAVGLFNAVNSTGNIKIVADKGHLDPAGCTYSAILAKPEWVAAHPTFTADSIRGATISVEPNSFSAFVLEQWLGTVGLTLNDVTIQYVPPANLIAAAQNGSVDFINTAEPWITRLLDTNKMVVWKGYQEIIPNMQVGFLDFGKSLSQEHPEIGDRFMAAYLQAVRQYNLGKTDRNLAILAQYTKLPTDLLQRICWPSINADGNFDRTSLMDFQTWAVGKGLLDKVAGEDAIWDPQFTEYANLHPAAATP